MRDPIVIDDSGLGWPPMHYTWAEAVQEAWCSGSGTEISPYIIEGLMIDADGNTYPCLSIRNSNAYFIIQNCTLIGSTGAAWYTSALEVKESSNGLITDNRLIDNTDNGVIVYENCNNITISSNLFNNNSLRGIYALYSTNIIISDNEISNSRYAIMGIGCNGLLINMNTVTLNTKGIWIGTNNAIIT